ncbi:MAG TPA: proline dehydrogenase [Ignavibacteria bacterium]|nr:proline dehydrogenase [Ignavibacteria bacterium]
MAVMRNFLLWCSENPTLRTKVPQMSFVQRALKRFMPGEEIDDAITASKEFIDIGIPTVLTRLGEDLQDLSEADEVTNHYLSVIDRIAEEKLDIEISLKLTQLGFNLSEEKTFENFDKIAERAEKLNNVVWIDMEGSEYTQKTINFYKRIKAKRSNVGLCLQSYLFSSHQDLNDLLEVIPNIRLVKGAYNEPHDIALRDKFRVDENYLDLARKMLEASNKDGNRMVFGTQDLKLIEAIKKEADILNYPQGKLEFQMLYGIKPNAQKQLVKEGHIVRVLISYGKSWYPWYMRRLAERPANIAFVLKNIFTK